MRTGILFTLAICFLLFFNPTSRAAATNAISSDLDALMMKIHGKLQGGKKDEADFADELKEFDALAAKHKGENPDDVADILLSKAMIYQHIFKDTARHEAVLLQIQQDFPDSKVAKTLKKQEEAKKVQENLKPGTKFPDFEGKDLSGQPTSVAGYKGKIVLLDFWATWCGPCVGELPNVLATYEKHHADGFEIIGISLDQDKEKLTTFLQQRKIPWRQIFDGKGWESRLALDYGIQSIPATFLLDGAGQIIGKDLRGKALEDAVTVAIARK